METQQIETHFNGVKLGNSRYTAQMGLCLCDENGQYITDAEGKFVPANPKRRNGEVPLTFRPEVLTIGPLSFTRNADGNTVVEMLDSRPITLNSHPFNRALFTVLRRVVHRLAWMQEQGMKIEFTVTVGERQASINVEPQDDPVR